MKLKAPFNELSIPGEMTETIVVEGFGKHFLVETEDVVCSNAIANLGRGDAVDLMLQDIADTPIVIGVLYPAHLIRTIQPLRNLDDMLGDYIESGIHSVLHCSSSKNSS